MPRTCIWCDGPLPDPPSKGHRRREFCRQACRQKHYLWRKRMRQDADDLREPFWKMTYQTLIAQYKVVERWLQERTAELAEERKRSDNLEWLLQHEKEKNTQLRIDYLARLKALGMSNDEIEAFDAFWRRSQEE